MRKVWDQVPSGTCARRDLTAPAGPAGLERKTGGFGMKKELIALGAALALVGTLTACSSTPAAVSYTHLDVYKRQGRAWCW